MSNVPRISKRISKIETDLVGHFLKTIERTDVIECVNGWRETTMQTENLSLDYCCQWEVVEKFGESLPDVCVSILTETLVVESVPESKT